MYPLLMMISILANAFIAIFLGQGRFWNIGPILMYAFLIGFMYRYQFYDVATKYRFYFNQCIGLGAQLIFLIRNQLMNTVESSPGK
jgi:hypothetical protein